MSASRSSGGRASAALRIWLPARICTARQPRVLPELSELPEAVKDGGSRGCSTDGRGAVRARKPAAFDTKLVVHETTSERDLSECVTRVTDSPNECRRVLYALAQLAADGTLTSDPKWDSTLTAAHRLIDDITAPRRVQKGLQGRSTICTTAPSRPEVGAGCFSF